LTVLLSGASLNLTDLQAVALGRNVAIETASLERMAKARAVLENSIADGAQIYGTTTGLGPRSSVRLSDQEADNFALATIRGRAHALGNPLPDTHVRAAMTARLNSLLIGASGARPDLAKHLCAMLNADLVPTVREIGSVGAADLIWGATLGLGIIGEGSVSKGQFAAAGLSPYQPAAREGLALASHSGFVAGIAGLGLARLEHLFEVLEQHACLSLQGFQANLSPLDADVIALRPQAREVEAAKRMRQCLSGSALFEPGSARRLQDPLSLRNIPQVHGSFLAAFEHAKGAVLTEINSPSDNPAVLIDRDQVLSNGSFLSIHLSLSLTALAQAISALASIIFARTARMLAGRFTGLSDGLSVEGAGLGPLLKPAEALFAEIAHLASPPVIHPSPSADGLEDQVSHAAIAAKTLHQLIEKLARLSSIEAVVAAQAIEITGATLPPNIQTALRRTRDHVAFAPQDRAMGEDIERLAQALLVPSIKEHN